MRSHHKQVAGFDDDDAEQQQSYQWKARRASSMLPYRKRPGIDVERALNLDQAPLSGLRPDLPTSCRCCIACAAHHDHSHP